MVHVQSDAQPTLIAPLRVGHLWRFDSGAFDYGLPGGRVPGLRAGAAHVVSDGAGGALCGFGGVDGVSTVSRGSEAQPGRAPLGGSAAASGVGTSMVRARP